MAGNLVRSSVQVTVDTLAQGVIGLETINSEPKKTYPDTLSNGVGANQAEAQWDGTVSLAAAGGADTVTLDLTALTGNPFGTVTFTKIREMILHNTETAGTVQVGAAATNPALIGIGVAPTGTLPVFILDAGGTLTVQAPTAGFVVSGTAKSLQFKNLGAVAAVIDVILIGNIS